jgi:predicted NAD/FAD-binding protein
MNIAVIGAGVSGLVAALLLGDDHRVTVYEAAARPGGHTNTVEVETEHGTYAVDTGFIVFNDRNYPNFERLLTRLGVASQPSNMSFSVADAAGRFEYAATGVNGLFATRSNLVSPRFARMVAEVPRFQRACLALLEVGGDDDEISLAGFLARERFSPMFVNSLIIPQAAAVWSADPAAMNRFPARFLATFFKNHGMLSLRGRPNWRVIRGGSRTYVEAILARLGRDRLRLSAPVTGLRRGPEGVTVTATGQAPETFDHVVVATHSDQALAMLEDASDRERELLGAIPYQSNQAVLHTDVRLLPQRRRAWASWNYHLLDPPSDRATVTYHMNRLQSLSAPEEFCVTLNRTEAIDPDKIIASFDYAHPVYTPAGVHAQARVAEISGQDRISFAGAYWGWGFHEDGVVSAVRVAERFGARL